jgi:ribosomal protein L37AE/L43A
MMKNPRPIRDSKMLKDDKARGLAYYAREKGMIEPQPCRDCGNDNPKNLHMHHEDYNLAYRVVWLCAKCHSKLHGNGKVRGLNAPPTRGELMRHIADLERQNRQLREALNALLGPDLSVDFTEWPKTPSFAR